MAIIVVRRNRRRRRWALTLHNCSSFNTTWNALSSSAFTALSERMSRNVAKAHPASVAYMAKGRAAMVGPRWRSSSVQFRCPQLFVILLIQGSHARFYTEIVSADSVWCTQEQFECSRICVYGYEKSRPLTGVLVRSQGLLFSCRTQTYPPCS